MMTALDSAKPSPKHSVWLSAFDSLLPYSLALVLISAFLTFIYLVITRQPVDLDLLKTLSAVFLGPIGTILGFYFGHRPAEKLEQRVQELIEVNKGMLVQLEQRKYELEREKEEATASAKRYLERMERAESVLQRIDNYVKK